MDAKPHTLKKLFGHEVRYVVPLFQRAYVWQKDHHWEPLWNDVLDAYPLAAMLTGEGR